MSSRSLHPGGAATLVDEPSEAGIEVAEPRLPEQPFPLHHLVEMQSRARPDHPAVEMAGEELTYRELDRAANRMAHAIRAAGCRAGDRVAFLLPKSPDAIVVILGILKADCVYVPLDPDSPPPRLARMIRRGEPSLVIASGDTRPLALGIFASDELGEPPRIGWLGEDPPSGPRMEVAFTGADVALADGTPPTSKRSPDEPAYVFFTSGSTGTPKGVVITHANVYHFVRWGVGYFGMGPEDRNSGHAPLHFDLSTFDIFGSFAAGATLHLVPPSLNLHPGRLADWIRERELTQWFSVPTALTYMASFKVVGEDDFPSLERVIWCGEVLPTPTLIHWMERVPHATYTNLYGPTEATVASSYHTVGSIPGGPREEIPIGVPCDGEDLQVLDERLEPVPSGEVGHLYIGGVGLSPGYWKDPEKTDAAFVEDPTGRFGRIYRTGDLAVRGGDGLFYFRSREDFQVKIRGYRIELGEIENAAFTVDGLRQAAVVAVETGGFQGNELACAYVPAEGADEVSPSRLRTELKKHLPGYMLPSRWMALDELPENRNGKVDRRRIEELFRDSTS